MAKIDNLLDDQAMPLQEGDAAEIIADVNTMVRLKIHRRGCSGSSS